MTTEQAVKVEVPCAGGCGAAVPVTHDELRAAVESGEPPKCAECSAPPEPKMTRVDRLLAAWAMDAAGAMASQSALIVAAWKRWPNVFGLEWYEDEHPDAKGTYLDILRAVKLKYAAWTREKHLELTKLGRAHGLRLAQLLKAKP